ncbi:carbohydrate ABC transporter permease [Caldalkalibacillus thermarum]|nr:sugar ABC transporter permease [Caldalkalibacillus thermarum]
MIQTDPVQQNVFVRVYKRLSSERMGEFLTGYVMLMPAMLLLAIFFFYPILFVFSLAFQDYNLLRNEGTWIGLENFKRLFDDGVFHRSLYNTFFYVIGVVPVQTAIAVLLALIVNANIRGKTFFRAAYFIPSITASVVASLIFLYIYSRNGMLNSFLSWFGVEPRVWFEDPTFALPSIMVMNIWSTIGQLMVLFLAGLQDIPEDVYEAAAIDGASPVQRFFYITLPLLKPTMFFVVVTGFIGTFQIFDQAFIVSGGTGGPQNATMTMALYLYINAFDYMDMGYAAAIAFVLFVIIFTVTVIQKSLFGDGSNLR